MDERTKYGFWVVLAGLLVILIVYGIAVYTWRAASDFAAAAGSVAGVVGTIVAAFFGVQVGSAGKERAQQQALELAGRLPAADFAALRAARPDLFGH